MTKFRRSLTLHFGRNMTFFYAETGMYGMYAPLQVRHYWLGIKYVMGVRYTVTWYAGGLS